MSKTQTSDETKREETEIREKLNWLLDKEYELKNDNGWYYIEHSGREYGGSMMDFVETTTVQSIEESGINVLGVEAKGDVARILLDI